MLGCLLKRSSGQVRKATDAEWLGAELSKTLAPELEKSPEKRTTWCVGVGAEDANQILEAVVPAPSVLAPIPEESDSWI